MSAPLGPQVLSHTEEWHLALLSPWGKVAVVLAVAAAVGALALAVWGARLERRRARRWTLVTLRLGSVTTALVLFFQPAVQFEDVTRLPNHVAVLVDGSESMSLSEGASEPTRAARAADLLTRSAPLFARLRAEHKIDFYSFSGDLSPTTEEAVAQKPPATGSATHLREALTAVRARYPGRELAGMVVLTDGIDNGRFAEAKGDKEPLDAEGQDFVRGLGAPVHVAWTARAGLHDIAVARVLADDFAFARNAIKVEAVIRTVGARAAGWGGRTLPVTLKRDGVVVRTVHINVEDSDKQRDQKVAFEFTPERVGKYLYEVAVPVLTGEAIGENNARTFLLKVIRDKIRVLLVAGRPSWDERFLRGLLKHDPNVDLISFFILRTPADVETVSPDEMSLIPFPTEELFLEQLRSFDVVFLQNFNYAPYGIGAYLGEIKRYVEEGGGLVMVGGDLSFTSGGYANSPVAEVLPVELLDEAPLERLVSLEPFRMQLSPDGGSAGHPILALRYGAEENRRRWAALPPLEGMNLVAGLRPGATALGVHPTLRTAAGRPMPVVAVTDVGKGRSLALMSDSTWRWGFGALAAAPDGRSNSLGREDTRGRAYQRFWENAIRWLIHDPELRFLRVESDQPEYNRADKVKLRIHARDPEYKALRGAAVTLTLARVGQPIVPDDKAKAPLLRTVHTDDDGEAELELDALPPGGYRVTAKARPAGGETVHAAALRDEEVFLVRGAGRELEEAEASDGLLRSIATASQASFIPVTKSATLEGLRFHEPQIVRVNQHRDLELWSTWISLVIAAAFLAAEWTLRRRWGLA